MTTLTQLLIVLRYVQDFVISITGSLDNQLYTKPLQEKFLPKMTEVLARLPKECKRAIIVACAARYPRGWARYQQTLKEHPGLSQKQRNELFICHFNLQKVLEYAVAHQLAEPKLDNFLEPLAPSWDVSLVPESKPQPAPTKESKPVAPKAAFPGKPVKARAPRVKRVKPETTPVSQ